MIKRLGQRESVNQVIKVVIEDGNCPPVPTQLLEGISVMNFG